MEQTLLMAAASAALAEAVAAVAAATTLAVATAVAAMAAVAAVAAVQRKGGWWQRPAQCLEAGQQIQARGHRPRQHVVA